VRLTPEEGPGRRRAPQRSTAAHRALEDRTLALVDSLAGRPVPAIGVPAVTEALRAEPGLGADQIAAVRMLTDAAGE